MYESYFELQEAPFSLTPNTHFFMPSESHTQALEMLLVGLANGEGFLKVTGEVGTGKSLICRMLLNHLENEYVTAYVPNPSCSPETLYCLIAEELRVADEDSLSEHSTRHVNAYFNDSLTSEKQMLALQKIQKKLLQLAEDQRRVVLIIDEAQAMTHATIEALRLLSNLETESQKLLQIVLFAQPELDKRLAEESLRQLAQRIGFHYTLKPLSEKGTAEYVNHRMFKAGGMNRCFFSGKALRKVAQGSMGYPRLINVICHKALMLSYGKGLAQVGVEQVCEAIRDTPSAQQTACKKPRLWPWGAIAIMAPVISVWVYQSMSLMQ